MFEIRGNNVWVQLVEGENGFAVIPLKLLEDKNNKELQKINNVVGVIDNVLKLQCREGENVFLNIPISEILKGI